MIMTGGERGEGAVLNLTSRDIWMTGNNRRDQEKKELATGTPPQDASLGQRKKKQNRSDKPRASTRIKGHVRPNQEKRGSRLEGCGVA